MAPIFMKRFFGIMAKGVLCISWNKIEFFWFRCKDIIINNNRAFTTQKIIEFIIRVYAVLLTPFRFTDVFSKLLNCAYLFYQKYNNHFF